MSQNIPARLRAWATGAAPPLGALLIEAAEAMEAREVAARQTLALDRIAMSLAKIAARQDHDGGPRQS